MTDVSTTVFEGVKKGDATRARILDEAMDQASVNGLGAVSLMDVARAVGLSKSGVFKHFQSKEALHLAVLETAAARFVTQVWVPAAALPKGRERLDRLFETWLEWTDGYWRGGCPLMMAARELDQQKGELRDYVQDSLRRWLDTVAYSFMALRTPPASLEEGEQAAFELNGVISSFKHSRSLGDPRAREKAQAGYEAIVARLS